MSGEATIGSSNVSSLQMTLILNMIQERLVQSAKLAPILRDRSDSIILGAKKFVIPKMDTDLQVYSKGEGSKTIAQPVSFGGDEVEMNKHKYVKVLIEDYAAFTSTPSLLEAFIREAARKLALQLDKDLYEELKLSSASSPDHRRAFASGSTLTLADFRTAGQLLDEASVPEEDRFAIISPANKAAVLAIADVLQAERYGNATPIQNGEIGMLSGFRVVVSNIVEATAQMFFHREAVSYAKMLSDRLKVVYDVDYLGEVAVLDQIYGSKQVQDGVMSVKIGSAS